MIRWRVCPKCDRKSMREYRYEYRKLFKCERCTYRRTKYHELKIFISKIFIGRAL